MGISTMRIFLHGNRLFMYAEAPDDFDPARDYAKYAARWERRTAQLRSLPLPPSPPPPIPPQQFLSSTSMGHLSAILPPFSYSLCADCVAWKWKGELQQEVAGNNGGDEFLLGLREPQSVSPSFRPTQTPSPPLAPLPIPVTTLPPTPYYPLLPTPALHLPQPITSSLHPPSCPPSPARARASGTS